IFIFFGIIFISKLTFERLVLISNILYLFFKYFKGFLSRYPLDIFFGKYWIRVLVQMCESRIERCSLLLSLDNLAFLDFILMLGFQTLAFLHQFLQHLHKNLYLVI